jgi:hypothetical protein
MINFAPILSLLLLLSHNFGQNVRDTWNPSAKSRLTYIAEKLAEDF